MPDINVTLVVYEHQIQSLEQYLAAQVNQKNHPETGAPLFEPIYKGIPEYLQVQVSNLLAGICSQYPNAQVKELLARRKAIDMELRAAVLPGMPEKDKK